MGSQNISCTASGSNFGLCRPDREFIAPVSHGVIGATAVEDKKNPQNVGDPPTISDFALLNYGSKGSERNDASWYCR